MKFYLIQRIDSSEIFAGWIGSSFSAHSPVFVKPNNKIILVSESELEESMADILKYYSGSGMQDFNIKEIVL